VWAVGRKEKYPKPEDKIKSTKEERHKIGGGSKKKKKIGDGAEKGQPDREGTLYLKKFIVNNYSGWVSGIVGYNEPIKGEFTQKQVFNIKNRPEMGR